MWKKLVVSVHFWIDGQVPAIYSAVSTAGTSKHLGQTKDWEVFNTEVQSSKTFTLNMNWLHTKVEHKKIHHCLGSIFQQLLILLVKNLAYFQPEHMYLHFLYQYGFSAWGPEDCNQVISCLLLWLSVSGTELEQPQKQNNS